MIRPKGFHYHSHHSSNNHSNYSYSSWLFPIISNYSQYFNYSKLCWLYHLFSIVLNMFNYSIYSYSYWLSKWLKSFQFIHFSNYSINFHLAIQSAATQQIHTADTADFFAHKKTFAHNQFSTLFSQWRWQNLKKSTIPGVRVTASALSKSGRPTTRGGQPLDTLRFTLSRGDVSKAWTCCWLLEGYFSQSGWQQLEFQCKWRRASDWFFSAKRPLSPALTGRPIIPSDIRRVSCIWQHGCSRLRVGDGSIGELDSDHH